MILVADTGELWTDSLIEPKVAAEMQRRARGIMVGFAINILLCFGILAAVFFSANAYSVIWALALAAIIFWAAHRVNRGMFNTGVTFASIHAYTQMFETFRSERLAYVIGGFATIPLAWGKWRLNLRWLAQQV